MAITVTTRVDRGVGVVRLDGDGADPLEGEVAVIGAALRGLLDVEDVARIVVDATLAAQKEMTPLHWTAALSEMGRVLEAGGGYALVTYAAPSSIPAASARGGLAGSFATVDAAIDALLPLAPRPVSPERLRADGERRGRAYVLSLWGVLDQDTAPALEDAIGRAVLSAGKRTPIIVDCEQLVHMDADGLGPLLKAASRLAPFFFAAAFSSRVKWFVDLMGVGPLLATAPSAEVVIADLERMGWGR